MAKRGNKDVPRANPLRAPSDAKTPAKREHYHLFRNHRCNTEDVGFETPRNLSPLDLVLHVSEGFIPLWEPSVILRWRIREQSLAHLKDKAAAKNAVRTLLGKALLAWGDAAPVKFTERDDAWDFEIVVQEKDNCNPFGCVLASAFFPDAGRHELTIYPEMFDQVEQEQIETLAHEIGHVFGLRHFFAKVSETAWPAELFGEHSKFSIMNYGPDSRLTDVDKVDLKRLYQSVWAGALTHINGTPIRQVGPFHQTGAAIVAAAAAVAQTG